MVEGETAVEINRVPGHSGVEGNKKTDKAAKEETERLGTRRYPERFASMAYVVRTIMERNWKEAKHWFRAENNRHPPL